MEAEGRRRGSLAPAPAPAPPGADRRPSLGAAALASLKGLGAKVAGQGGRRPSRMSFAVPGTGGTADQGPSRRGSVAVLPPAVPGAAPPSAAPDAASKPGGSGATPMHPGLERIKSFT